MKKKALTMFVAASLCVSLLAVPAFADELSPEDLAGEAVEDTTDGTAVEDGEETEAPAEEELSEDAATESEDVELATYDEEVTTDDEDDEDDEDDDDGYDVDPDAIPDYICEFTVVDGNEILAPGDSATWQAATYSMEDFSQVDPDTVTYEWSVHQPGEDDLGDMGNYVTLSDIDGDTATLTVSAESDIGYATILADVYIDGEYACQGMDILMINDGEYNTDPDEVDVDVHVGETVTIAGPQVKHYDNDGNEDGTLDEWYVDMEDGMMLLDGYYQTADGPSDEIDEDAVDGIVKLELAEDGSVTLTGVALDSQYTSAYMEFEYSIQDSTGGYICGLTVCVNVYPATVVDDGNDSDDSDGSGDSDNSDGSGDSDSSGSDTSGTDTVKTGDTSGAAIWVVAIIACGAAVAVTARRRRA